MSTVKLRSDYRKFLNRCDRCGHRLSMHNFDEGNCKVIYNGDLPNGQDHKCNCTYYKVGGGR
jgi:hypothetical protein